MKSGKKLLSLILALCMVLSVIGVAAFAADTESSEPVGDQPVALSVPNAQDLKGLVEKYFGSTQAFANFVADTVGRIVTGTKSDHLAEVIVNAFENGIIIGNISQMTDEEVKVMLDQIYWVYADNPGPITQTVDCIKMFVNWCDASIHRGQDGLLLGTMQKKLATYYWNWLKENCSPDWWDPNRPTDPSEPYIVSRPALCLSIHGIRIFQFCNNLAAHILALLPAFQDRFCPGINLFYGIGAFSL